MLKNNKIMNNLGNKSYLLSLKLDKKIYINLYYYIIIKIFSMAFQKYTI